MRYLAVVTTCLALAVAEMRAADPGLRRFLDLTVSPVERSPKYVVFCGRETLSADSTPGHAYVVFGYEDDAKKLCAMDAFGFYPTNKVKGAISVVTSVPSRVANEFLEHGVKDGECMFVVQVDEQVYQMAQKVLKDFEAKDYALREQDCVTFASFVATTLGLSIPNRGALNLKLPAKFIRELADANPQNNFLNGTWESSDPQKRFRVVIRGKDCDWVDRPKEGQTIRTQGTLLGDSPTYTLERRNDDQVLTLLGFQPSLRQAILSRSPAPSVFQLSRNGDRLKGVWKALVAIKDEKAKLKAIEFRESQWEFIKLTK